MLLRHAVRQLIVGNKRFIHSYHEYRQVMLSGQFALIGIFICAFYLLMDIATGEYFSLPVFCCSIALLCFSIFLHRKEKHLGANFVLLPTLNFTVYLFASSEPPETGAFLHFISSGIAAFIVFGYKHRLYSMIFLSITYLLFVMAYFVNFSILPWRDYSEEILLLNRVMNFTTSFFSASIVVYLLICLNHYNSLQLVANNKLLKKANEELDRFVYSTSHDLRAPLTSIMGLINITDITEDGGQVKRYLQMMRERVMVLDNFIKDITDYSRNNRQAVERQKVNLSSLTQEIWEGLRFSPEAQDVNFLMDIPEAMEVNSDRNRLKTVLLNLLSNAIRYHDIEKQEKFIRVAAHPNGLGFYLQVQDNGQGIAAEHQSRIFEMFFRAHEKSKGSGLGLYIVKETLGKLSGTISIESAPGEGSTFTIKIPY